MCTPGTCHQNEPSCFSNVPLATSKALPFGVNVHRRTVEPAVVSGEVGVTPPLMP